MGNWAWHPSPSPWPMQSVPDQPELGLPAKKFEQDQAGLRTAQDLSRCIPSRPNATHANPSFVFSSSLSPLALSPALLLTCCYGTNIRSSHLVASRPAPSLVDEKSTQELKIPSPFFFFSPLPQAAHCTCIWRALVYPIPQRKKRQLQHQSKSRLRAPAGFPSTSHTLPPPPSVCPDLIPNLVLSSQSFPR